MRIELNAGGLGGAVAISGFHTDFSGLISKSKKALSVFQVVRQQSYNMNGGIGNLQGAVNEIETRISAEETKVSAIETVEKKTNSFLELAIKTDIQASIQVNKSKNEFYRVNPWAKPPAPPEEKKWYQKAGEWLYNRGKDIIDGTRRFISWAGDTIKKAWNGLVDFCKAHWKEILIGLAAITIGAVLTAITGGGAAAFLPALLAGLKSAAIAGLISGGINSIISTTTAIINGESINAGTIFSSFGDGFASGFMFGGIMAGCSMTISSGFRIAAKSGVPTGRGSGIGKDGIFKILSPDRIASDNQGGGTLIKIGRKFHIDVDTRIIAHNNPLKLANFLHMHLPNFSGNIPALLIPGGHIPIGIYTSSIFAVIKTNKK